MGNLVTSVKAASSLELPPPLPSLDEVSTFKTENEPEIINNPGTVEDLHKKTRDVIPTPFDGARIAMSKPLSQNFQITHTINMLPTQPSGYRFGVTFVDFDAIKNPQEPTSLLAGDVDPSGNVNANVIHQLNDRLKGKLQAQMSQSNNMGGAQGVLEYKGDRFTSSLTAVNIDVVNNSGVIVGHHLHAVTPNVALGCELARQYGKNVPGGSMTFLSLAGRYSTPDYALSAVVGSANFHLCYYQKASDELQVGVEVDTKFKMLESVGTLAYQADIPKADVTFKGSIDTNWTVAGVLEKKLQPLPVTLTLSGALNHAKSKFQLGCGFVIG